MNDKYTTERVYFEDSHWKNAIDMISNRVYMKQWRKLNIGNRISAVSHSVYVYAFAVARCSTMNP